MTDSALAKLAVREACKARREAKREAQLAGPLVHEGDAPWVSLGAPRPG